MESLCMGICSHWFLRVFSSNRWFFNKIISCTHLKKLVCLVALLVFEQHFHFGSNTFKSQAPDHITMLNSSMKTSIQSSWYDLRNKTWMTNNDFWKIATSSIAIVMSSISSEISIQGLNGQVLDTIIFEIMVLLIWWCFIGQTPRFQLHDTSVWIVRQNRMRHDWTDR